MQSAAWSLENTFIAALRYDWVTAPLLLDGPMNGASFLAYVEQILAPTVRRGDIVIQRQRSKGRRCPRGH